MKICCIPSVQRDITDPGSTTVIHSWHTQLFQVRAQKADYLTWCNNILLVHPLLSRVFTTREWMPLETLRFSYWISYLSSEIKLSVWKRVIINSDYIIQRFSFVSDDARTSKADPDVTAEKPESITSYVQQAGVRVKWAPLKLTDSLLRFLV